MQCRSYVGTKKVMGLQLIFHLERNIIRSSVFSKAVFFQETFDEIIFNFRTSKL